MTRPRQRSVPLLRESSSSIQSRPVRRRNPDQPSLPFDAMPSRVEPCLALLKQTVPQGPDWLYEVKWDGYRLAIHIEPRSIRILTRGGHDWTHRFPTVAAGARELGVASCILDGEAVVLDEEGRSDFGALQRSLGGRGGKRISTESVFCAFDLLYLDGHDLTRTELSVRRHLLQDLIPETENGAIRFSQDLDLAGEELLEHACHLGLEGIIAKRRDSPYRSGRLGDWQKIKCVQSDSFMIVGYEESASTRGGLGSLLLAGRNGQGWIYVGSVGTGFNRTEAEDLRKTLNRLQTKKPVVPLKGKRLVFSQPTLIAEIEFRGWTREGSLRHPSYKGLREIQDNAAVFDMTDATATTGHSAGD